MKKWLMLGVLGAAVVATAGFSSLPVASQEHEPTDAEVDAQVDARLHEVMRELLAAQRSEASTAARGR
jgi:hypothetical protein